MMLVTRASWLSPGGQAEHSSAVQLSAEVRVICDPVVESIGWAGEVDRFPYRRATKAQRKAQSLDSIAEGIETLEAFSEDYASMEAALITKASRKATSVSVLSAIESSSFFSALTSVAPRLRGKASRESFSARRRSAARIPGHSHVPLAYGQQAPPKPGLHCCEKPR
jgi:hypothetical protein